ncbi:MAG: sugar ABC transporter permease, partial [Sarcina sp.]
MQANLDINHKSEKILKYKKKLRPTEKRIVWISRIVIWCVIAIVIFPILAVVTASMAEGQVF